MHLIQKFPLSYIAISAMLVLPLVVYGIQTQFYDDNIQITLTYPQFVTREKEFLVSAFIANRYAYGILDNVTLTYKWDNSVFKHEGNSTFFVDKLSVDGLAGHSVTFYALNATTGKHFLNLVLSYTVKDEETFLSRSLEIDILESSRIDMFVNYPQAIFVGEPFPFEVELHNAGADAKNVTLMISPPEDLIFRGQTRHAINSLSSDLSAKFIAQLETPKAITIERFVPIDLNLTYVDEAGNLLEDSRTVSVLLRPRGNFEIGAQGGIWIDGLFISPTIGIGTLVFGTVGFFTWLFGFKRRKGKKPQTRT